MFVFLLQCVPAPSTSRFRWPRGRSLNGVALVISNQIFEWSEAELQ